MLGGNETSPRELVDNLFQHLITNLITDLNDPGDSCSCFGSSMTMEQRCLWADVWAEVPTETKAGVCPEVRPNIFPKTFPGRPTGTTDILRSYLNHMSIICQPRGEYGGKNQDDLRLLASGELQAAADFNSTLRISVDGKSFER